MCLIHELCLAIENHAWVRWQLILIVILVKVLVTLVNIWVSLVMAVSILVLPREVYAEILSLWKVMVTIGSTSLQALHSFVTRVKGLAYAAPVGWACRVHVRVVGWLLLTFLLFLLLLLFHILILHGLVQVAVVIFFCLRTLIWFHSVVHSLLRLLVGLSAGTIPLVAVVLSFTLLGVVFFVRVLFIPLAHFFEVVAVIRP